MTLTPEFIREAIEKQSYIISLHADDERIADGLTVLQLEFALSDCKIIEEYPDDPRGESCLALGFLQDGKAIHIVCGKNQAGHLILVTVYLPSMPKWKDPYKRNR